MRKTYKILNLDCANCAMKLEAKINKIKHVNRATINFFSQKLLIEIDEPYFDEVIKQVEKVIYKFQPNCTLQSNE